MNVYLDGSWLAAGIGLTGTRRFSAELNDAVIARLSATRMAIRSHVFSIHGAVQTRFRRPGVRYVVVPSAYRFLLWSNAMVGRPDLTRRLDPAPDRIHIHDAIRFSGGRGGHSLVTVCDLAALREPRTYPARAVWLRRRSMQRLRDSDAIVHTISEATRADVIDLAGIPADRVHTVPLGVRPSFFEAVPMAERTILLRTLGIDRPFVTHVGAPHRRKNIPFLLDCFREVLRRGRDALLVLIGPGVAEQVDAWCRTKSYTAEERGRVRCLGALPDDQVRACLQASAGLCVPSLYEGFGLPALEAMASGAPVVASDRSSLPEVVGDAGILRDPTDRDAWVEAIEALLTSPGLREDLAARGRVRAARFSWDRTADELLALMKVPLQ